MASFARPSHTLDNKHRYSGSTAWRSPSNIALIKYWGKRPVQLPQNASISFTLQDAHTDTSITYKPRDTNTPWIHFLFDGQQEPSFAKRIESFFTSILEYFPFLAQLEFAIESKNSFPHSSGIASSASSMSALAMCLCDIENQLFFDASSEIDLQKASYIARLGSGSASRSVYPTLAAWGTSNHITEASDLYAIPYSDIHEVYKTFHDDVLIVSAEKKSVSSSAGHQLMETNVFASSRYEQADKHMGRLLNLMKGNDLNAWGEIVENEAMTLHALMMCSNPSYVLMKPETLTVIEELRRFRKDSGVPVYFTLDAGPNIHILYPDEVTSSVKSWLEDLIIRLPDNCYLIPDQVGQGPLNLGHE